MAVRSTGRCAICARRLLCLALVTLLQQPLQAAEAPVADSQLIPPAAEAPYQVNRETEQQVRWLDPAIFTQISPLNVPEVAVKLPADQEE